MIDEEYRQLIQKDIDGVNSSDEHSSLMAYLERNPEANRLHSELSALSDMLERLPDKEPPENLKKNILNSLKPLQAARATFPKRAESGLKVLSTLFSLRFGLTFAAGLLVGLGLYALTDQPPGSMDSSEIYGAMIQKETPDGFSTAVSHVIDLPQVQGSLELKHSGNHLRLELSTASSLKLDALISYEESEIGFRGMAGLNGVVHGTIEVENNQVLLSDVNGKSFAIVFDRKLSRDDNANEQLTVNLRSGETGRILFSKAISVSPPRK